MKVFRVFLKIFGLALAAVFAVIVTSVIAFGINFGDDFSAKRTLTTFTSPDGAYVCSVHTSTGGILSPRKVVATVKGPGIFGNRTIYVVKHIDEAVVIWVDDQTVWINGVSLDIYRDKYVSEVDRLYGP
ncbi:MAG: DUF5412 family protein [Eubacteriales bacterium]|nr:DUF5412 family protein [Eubacteriales bacterium]